MPNLVLLKLVIVLLVVAAVTGASPPSAGLPTIEWDPATLRLIERGADYGRMTRLPDGSVACVYDRGGRMYFRRSIDDGVTFADAVLVAADADCWLTNASLLALQDGSLLYLWNERPRLAVAHRDKPAAPGLLTRPFLIRSARSRDLGRTWSVPQALYTAGASYQDGCWEPAAVQLRSGEIQVYFANEFPYQTTDEQEIALVRSTDNGQSWSKAERIGFRERHRDGMPAPILLQNGGLAVAIEDNGLAGDRFKISILTSADNWGTAPVTGDHPQRHGALADPLPPQVYAGAPHLVQLSTGHTLLSCQESDDGTLHSSRMAVYVGDRDARNFASRTQPLPAAAGGAQLWNALFVKDPRTVVAVLTTVVDGVRGVYCIEGRIIFPGATE